MIKKCNTLGCENIPRSNGISPKTGKLRKKAKCGACLKAIKAGYPIYHTHKKSYCEVCDFKAVHPIQLDVDHIDGDKFNGDPTNLRTMCANCHRLKTHQERDYVPTEHR